MVRFSHFSKSILVKVFNRRETIRLASPPFVFGNILKPTDHAFGRLGWTLASCFITVGFDFPNCVLISGEERASALIRPSKAIRHLVGTHGSCLAEERPSYQRYRNVVLTGTATRLDRTPIAPITLDS